MLLDGLGMQRVLLHPEAECITLPAIGSDHTPLLLSLGGQTEASTAEFDTVEHEQIRPRKEEGHLAKR